MLTQEERKIKIKQMIEEKPGTHHTKLLEMIKKQGIMAKRTAEKIIEQLIDDREITVFTQKRKTCYSLKGDGTFKGNLPTLFSTNTKAIKEKLESMEKDFEAHSYDAQCHMCDELCEALMKQIERSEEFAKGIDRGWSEYDDEYADLYSEVEKLSESDNIDKNRRHKILNYLRNAMSVVRVKARDVSELDEKRKGMKQSEKREEISNQSRQLHSQIRKVMSDTMSIEHALKHLQDRADIMWVDESSELGRYCRSLDHVQKNAGESMEAMMNLIEGLMALKKREDEAEQTEQLNSQVLEIKPRLEEIEKIINALKMCGIRNELIEELDSEISKAELHLEEMKGASQITPQGRT